MTTKVKATPHPNHIDYALGTEFGDAFELENVIDAVIEFANGAVGPDPKVRVRPNELAKDERGIPRYLLAEEGRMVVTDDRALALQHFAYEVAELRAYAVDTLAIAVSGLAPLTSFLSSFSEDIDCAIDIAVYPTIKFDQSGQISLGWRTSGPSNHQGWIRYAALLIAQRSKGDAPEVGRCNLPSCGKFFRIESKGRGRPSSRYCPGTDHMSVVHALDSTTRSRKKRRRDAEARVKPKSRRKSIAK